MGKRFSFCRRNCHLGMNRSISAMLRLEQMDEMPSPGCANRPRQRAHIVVRIGVSESGADSVEEILAVDERDGALDRGLCRNFGPLETITPPGPCGRSGGEEVQGDYKVIEAVFQEPNDPLLLQ